MPRGSTTIKRLRGATTQIEPKNEKTVIVGGKKTCKKKSKGHIILYDNIPRSTTSTPSPPSTPPPIKVGYGSHTVLNYKSTNPKNEPEFIRMDSTTYCDSSSELYQSTSGILMHENHRQIDVNATKNPGIHKDFSSLSFALTILRSCPLSDTIAILIVLLQIPPTFLSMIQLLFATLTFIPSSSMAASSLAYTDSLKGLTSAPSLTTILILDVAVLLVWLFMWSPIQVIAFDFAQAVIALTLGGGASNKEAGIKNILWCFGIIGASHFVQAGNAKNRSLQDFISSGLSSSPDPDDPLEPVIHKNGKKFGLIRSVLAIHILTQGVVRCVRDWYMRRENQDVNTTFGDPEIGKLALDLNSESTMSSTTENESSTPLEANNPIITPKKKRKNCAQVRTHQPLWAALASTKIVMVKEYETSHAAAESAGTNATDMNNLGNAPFSSEIDKIWITYVGSDEIFFSTSFFFAHSADNEDEDGLVSCDSSIDKSKPFYVKVNNTVWKPIKIYPTGGSEKASGPVMRWSGEIFGLAPTSNYDCAFISTVDKSLLFSTSIRTLQSPNIDLELSSVTKAAARPSTPYSTLKASIDQAGKKLQEDRQRQKSLRKDLRAKLNSVRKEFERLIGNVASTGSNDDKLRQKAQQSTLHMKQADEAASILVSQIETIDSIPTDETFYSQSRNEIQSQKEKHENVCSEFKSRKHAFEREIQNLSSELTTLQQKSETKKQRLSILNSKHESIVDATTKGLDEVQRRDSKRELKRKERANIQAFYSDRLQSITIQIYEGQAALHAVTSAIETLLQPQQDLYQRHSPGTGSPNMNRFGDSIPVISSIKPENYPWNSPLTSTNSFIGSGLSHLMNNSINSPQPGHNSRDRRSSILLNASNSVQSLDYGLNLSFVGKKLLAKEDDSEDKKKSDGFVGGGGAGSIGDSKSPIVVNSKVNSKG